MTHPDSDHPLFKEWSCVVDETTGWGVMGTSEHGGAEVYVGILPDGSKKYSWNHWPTCKEKGYVYLTDAEIAIYRLTYELEMR